MSRRDLKKFVNDLNKEQLEEQILALYDKFKEVKVFYDFVFHPKENELAQEAKLKITNEYFPIRGKKPKMRRSVAQTYIKHFIVLEVDPFIVADVMLYHIEIAQSLTSEKEIKQLAFFRSMLNAFQQAIAFMIEKGVLTHFMTRVVAIKDNTVTQHWPTNYGFTAAIERLEY